MEQILWNLIKQGLQSAINTHGPVTKHNCGSAIKRIVLMIIESNELKESNSDLFERIRVDTLEFYYKCEINSLKVRLSKATKELKKLSLEIDEANSTSASKQEWIDRLRKSVEDINKEKNQLRQELQTLKRNYQTPRIAVIRHQLTQKIAWNLWNASDRKEGCSFENWIKAEKIADALLKWKPNGKDNYYEEEKAEP